jgi:Uma2 family endonuclease
MHANVVPAIPASLEFTDAEKPHVPDDARERPRLAPDIAVDILSPGDSRKTLAEKIALYLRHGARVVIALDPDARTITQHMAGLVTKSEARGSIEVLEHPGLTLDADDLFANRS